MYNSYLDVSVSRLKPLTGELNNNDHLLKHNVVLEKTYVDGIIYIRPAKSVLQSRPHGMAQKTSKAQRIVI